MFTGVNEKLERAGYCLNNLKTLAEDAGGFACIKIDKWQELRANLDCFFFEIISAKDFFLQGITDHYRLGLRKREATDIAKLKRCLSCKDELGALEMVVSLKTELDRKDSWLWRLNNYRNTATHRELLGIWYKVGEGPTVEVEAGEEVQFQIELHPETRLPIYLKRTDRPSEKHRFKYEDTRAYLFEDPEDPSQGNADMEVIPYCEQSLTQMKEFLERLYSELELE